MSRPVYDLRPMIEARNGKNRAEYIRLRNAAVVANMGLVHMVIHRLFSMSEKEEHPDLMQAGAIGLMTALDRFDLSRGNTFGSYAVNWIRHEIGVARGRMNPSNDRKALRRHKVWMLAETFRDEHGREPTAEDLGVSKNELRSCGVLPRSVDLKTWFGRPQDDDRSASFQEDALHWRASLQVESLSDAATPEELFRQAQLQEAFQAAVAGLTTEQFEVFERACDGKPLRKKDAETLCDVRNILQAACGALR